MAFDGDMDSSDDDAPVAVPLQDNAALGTNAAAAAQDAAPHQPVPVTLITGRREPTAGDT